MKYPDTFRVRPGSRVQLASIDPDSTGEDRSKAAGREEVATLGDRLADLQELMYVEAKRSLLVVLQAMDAGGKDGTVNHVISYMNPQGVTVHPFKAPSANELAHDYLWRVHKVVPAKGHVAVFNRSHYEDVLVVRVDRLAPKEVWSRRYDEINAFEKFLSDNGTHIAKFYLHVDKEEQLNRFKDRLDNPKKHWKVSEADYAKREFWDEYQKAYEDAISRCSTEYAPWYVIPANHKWFRNLAISRILVKMLESLEMEYPPLSADIKEVRRLYHEAAKEGS